MNKYSLKFVCIILAALLLSPALFSDNQLEIQPAPEKIREIALEKVLEFTDDGDTFYFKYPRNISADADQNIYILDGKRLLKFSKNGTFIKNLLRKGEGPGEVKYVSNYLLKKKEIIVHSNNPSKIILISTDGKLIKEFRLKKTDWLSLCHYYDNTYYFFDSDVTREKGDAKIVDAQKRLVAVSDDGQTVVNLVSFPVKTYVAANGGSWGSMSVVDFHAVFITDKHFFVTENPNYHIKRFDLEPKKISRRFASQCQNVVAPDEFHERFKDYRMYLNGKEYRRPTMKYFDDIRGLLVHKNQLWAVTSTFDQEKGTRVDVYDFEGKRTDSFFLLLPGKSDPYAYKCNIVDNFLYVLDKNEDDETTVLKYAINF